MILLLLVLLQSKAEWGPGPPAACGTCARSIPDLRQADFSKDTLDFCCFLSAVEAVDRPRTIRRCGPPRGPVVADVNAAVKARSLPDLVASFPERGPGLDQVLVHLQALRCRARGDLEGLLKIVSDTGRADRFGHEFMLEIADVAGTLGPSIVDRLERKMAADPSIRPWAMRIIAATRTARARALVRDEMTFGATSLHAILDGGPRPRDFTIEELCAPGTVKSIEEGIRLACARMGRSIPDDMRVSAPPRKGPREVPWMEAGVTVLALVAILLLRR